MAGRFSATSGSGFRSNAADFDAGAEGADRGGFGAEQNPSADQSQDMMSSQLAGNPHSSTGFRRALEHTPRQPNRIKAQLPSGSTFAGKGFRKPNYFAQGGRRHGMHISTGAPHTGAAQQEGSDAGGE